MNDAEVVHKELESLLDFLKAFAGGEKSARFFTRRKLPCTVTAGILLLFRRSQVICVV